MRVLPLGDINDYSATYILVFLIGHLILGAVFKPRGVEKPLFYMMMEQAARDVDRRLNREGRLPGELMARGVVAAGVMLAMSMLVGVAVSRIATHTYGFLAVFLFLGSCASVMGSLHLLRKVAHLLSQGDTTKAAAALQPFCQDDLTPADAFTLARRALETSAVRLNRYFVAPLLFFFFFRSEGVAFYVACMAMHDAYGLGDKAHVMFAAPIRALERVVDFIPARLTGVFIAFAALFVSKGRNPFSTLALMIQQSAYYTPANTGWLIAAEAGALGVTLGGAVRHNNETVERKWLGKEGDSARLGAQDVVRASLLHFVVFLLVFCVFIGVFVASHNFS